MIYGYLRVSTDKQDVNSQKQDVDGFAKANGWHIDEYITDEGVSGGKNPEKRNLGPLLDKVKNGDKIISSEISRLGRDLYMVMDILHLCMERGVVVYTVKDRFVLGDDVTSKVLAFAFGLAAEIERQMIRLRTKEGLRLRMKMGVLVGRPPGVPGKINATEEMKTAILEQYKWGVPLRRLAKNFNVDRNTIDRWLSLWGVKEKTDYQENAKSKRKSKAHAARKSIYYKDNDGEYCVVDLPRETVVNYILQDMSIPQIHEKLPSYTYEQIYDTILCDEEFNKLYRQHAQKKLRKNKFT